LHYEVLAICTTTLFPPVSYALADVGHGLKQGGKALNTTAYCCNFGGLKIVYCIIY